MLIKRSRQHRGIGEACPHCGQTLAGQLVHIEGATFLCYRCLREIHAETRRRVRSTRLAGRTRQPTPS